MPSREILTRKSTPPPPSSSAPSTRRVVLLYEPRSADSSKSTTSTAATPQASTTPKSSPPALPALPALTATSAHGHSLPKRKSVSRHGGDVSGEIQEPRVGQRRGVNCPLAVQLLRKRRREPKRQQRTKMSTLPCLLECLHRSRRSKDRTHCIQRYQLQRAILHQVWSPQVMPVLFCDSRDVCPYDSEIWLDARICGDSSIADHDPGPA